MIKKILSIAALVAMLASCGNKTQKQKNIQEENTKVTVDEVLADIQTYVDQEILISGTVNHVCSHGGKRMFIMGTNPDAAIKITPNNVIGIFEKELEGSDVLVTGLVKELRIDESYVAELEKEVAEGADNEAIHDHSAGTHDEEAENEKKAQLDAMRNKIAESEQGYYSQFWIEASEFVVQEYEHTEGEDHDHDHAEEEHQDMGNDDDHDHEHGEDGHTH